MQTQSPSLLRDLGIVGYDAAFVPIVAALAAELPLLLIGSHGSAKTLLCERLAAALGERFIAYDASKALFEDILGFPDPASLAEGTVRYVATPISIWDKGFVLIDELSRATPEMQNKWLEVIRSRRLMGEAIPRLRYLFAAMNPSEYLGAHELDPALVGRFAFFVRAPEPIDLTVEERLCVIEGEARPPAPARITEVGRRIRSLLVAARRRLQAFPTEFGEELRRYVHELWAELLRGEISLDGRRLALLYQGLRACCAVVVAQGRTWDEARTEIGHWLPMLIPPDDTGDAERRSRILAAHLLVRERSELTERPILGELQVLLDELARDPDDDALRAHYERIRSRLTDPEPEHRAEAVVALEALVAHLCTYPKLAPDQRHEILELYRRLVDLEAFDHHRPHDRSDYLAQCAASFHDETTVHAALLAAGVDNLADLADDQLAARVERHLRERSAPGSAAPPAPTLRAAVPPTGAGRGASAPTLPALIRQHKRRQGQQGRPPRR